MNRIEIEMPDGTIIDAPEGVTKSQILARYQKAKRAETIASDPSEYDSNSPEFRAKYGASSGSGFLQNAIEGAGKAITDIGRGAGQLIGVVSNQDVADSRERDQDLTATTGGKVGQIVGGVAVGAPALMIPGANTVLGAGAIGAGFGALQPATSAKERALNTAVGGVTGAAAQYLGGKVAQWASTRKAAKQTAAQIEQSQNVVRDATLQEARQAGYVVPPSTTNPTVKNRIIEGVSGKAQTQQAAAVKNQRVTNSLARKALGLGERVPLNKQVLNSVRSRAGGVYKAIEDTGEIITDANYIDDLSEITGAIDQVAKDFPDMNLSANEQISGLVDSLLRDKFSAKGAIEATKQLRKSASGNLSGVNAADPAKRALGFAQRDAAAAIEDQLIRHLESVGKGSLAKEFDASRKLIAKTYSVEAALNEGTGNIVASNLAAQLKRGKPLDKELELIAKFGQAFKKASQEITDSPGVSALDALIGLGGSSINPAFLAIPALRIGTRSAILSKVGQGVMVNPSYVPGVKALDLLRGAGNVAGLPAAAYTTQQ